METDNNEIDITNLPTMKDVFDLIMRKYPDWMIDTCDKYSSDYPHFTNNWNHLLKISKTNPQKIILVKHFENDEQLSFSELLFSAGFIVRTIHEFTPCTKCHSAIPSLMTYNKIKDNPNIITPREWKDHCSNC